MQQLTKRERQLLIYLVEMSEPVTIKKLAEKERTRIRNMKVNVNVGDSICREDYDVPLYQYSSRIFYQGYVESKSGNKIKVRIVRHGGEKDIINDVTPNPVVWVENKGWFHC